MTKSRNTGLKQKSADWVQARQDTISTSEIAALRDSKKLASEKNATNRCIIMWLVHGQSFWTSCV